MKKFFIALCGILCMVFSTAYAAGEAVTVYVNEAEMLFDSQPYISAGTTMVPMRKIFESLGAQVEWDAASKTISVQRNGTQILLQINNPYMMVNGQTQPIYIAPEIMNGVTYVPTGAVFQALDADVLWLEQTGSVYINSPNTYYSDFAAVTPIITMYSADGRTIDIFDYEVPAYEAVGWYTEPVKIMYAADGRTLYVKTSEIEAYKNVGWYTQPPRSEGSYSGGSSDGGSVYNGSTVYITPTGKRYHYSKACAGKNASEASLSTAVNLGLTPCGKCAK